MSEGWIAFYVILGGIFAVLHHYQILLPKAFSRSGAFAKYIYFTALLIDAFVIGNTFDPTGPWGAIFVIPSFFAVVHALPKPASS